ncbi:MAG: TolC family protein [Acidobacteriota bacterium]|nr:TolC family protein [Acidobacteriota bacterium]
MASLFVSRDMKCSTSRHWAVRLTVFLMVVSAAGAIALGQAGLTTAPSQGDLQTPIPPPTANQSATPLTLTLEDAITRAEKNSPQFQTAATAVKAAHENRIQARAAMLPSVDYTTQYLNTQGNGISPVGRFVTNDGVHVYRAWGVVHEAMPGSFFINAGPRSAAYAEALAKASEEVARRGLVLTVTTDYYALAVAQRDYATSEISLENARRFLAIAKQLEQGGEVAHTDVIRFQLQYNQQEQAFENAKLAVTTARLNLSVLLFPNFDQDYTVVDDLDIPPPLPSFAEAASMASTNNPEVRAAFASFHQDKLAVSIARAAFYPSLSVDLDYGIEANAFALYSINNDTGLDRIRQPNLGYFVTYAVNLPIWDWGSRLSKLRQAKDQRALGRLKLSFAQRQTLAHLYSFYNEARVAYGQIATLRDSVDLASHNLQLVTMQYKAGEAAVLQVLDAETSLATARDAYAAGEARYRDALASLQTVTGSF